MVKIKSINYLYYTYMYINLYINMYIYFISVGLMKILKNFLYALITD